MHVLKTNEVLSLVIGLAVTSVVLPLLLKILRRREMFDLPNDRSSHEHPTPRGAGVAQLIGLVAAWSSVAWIPFWGFLGAAAYGLLGFVDDLKSQRPSIRLSIQLLLGLFTSAILIGRSTSFALTTLLLVGVTAFVVLVVNAANFMDGINGLSALHGAILGASYWMLLSWQDSEWAPIAAALVGVSIAFLPWNWGRRARMFLGDAGSYLLGALMSVFAIAAWRSGVNPLVAVGPLAIYLADVLRTLFKRLSQRRPLLTAHRDHVYQELVSIGYSHSQVTLMAAACSSAVAAVALVAHWGDMASVVIAALLFVFGLLYLSLPWILKSRGAAALRRRD